jgi:hypothetical protein
VKRKSAPVDAAQQIDAAYGLEPVFEPGAGEPVGESAQGSAFHLVQCPYCGESFETLIDLSAGSATYLEDCQVCCQPIEFNVAVEAAGTLESLVVGRGD